jgi:hypothetical protein
MRHFGTRPAWLWSSLAFAVSTGLLIAAPPGNPYLVISERNVFALRPPPPAHPPPPEPIPKVVPVGIATILGVKQALLKVYYPAHPPQPPREDSCVLTVGQREGPIEVLAINEAEGKIEIENSGTTMELILDRDAPRQPGPLMPRVLLTHAVR